MKFAKIHSAQSELLSARIIDIEVDVSEGLHSFSIIGLTDKAIDESRDRVSAAIKYSGFKSPKSTNARVTISLAPAHIQKTGPLFDVAIALGYLLASKEILFDPEKKLFLGELSLNGDIKKVQGILPSVLRAKELGYEDVFVPKENSKEAALVEDINIYGVSSLSEILSHINTLQKKCDKTGEIEERVLLRPEGVTKVLKSNRTEGVFFDDIRGQEHAKRALTIAAAGNHNIMFHGPPGTGKTMLAKALQTIMPPLTKDEIYETTSIYSVSGELESDYVCAAPFRAPHNTSTFVSIIGGGSYKNPGEITMAHNGVLFLDEFPEFDRRVIDSLRGPLEDAVITVARANSRITFPANILLVAAMNPCPCGYLGSSKRRCSCPQFKIENYQKKISGPILDRIDMWIEVPEVDIEKLTKKHTPSHQNTEHESVRESVLRAQTNGASLHLPTLSASLTPKQLESYTSIEESAKNILKQAITKLGLSARSYYKIYKVALTISLLENSKMITKDHILESLQYRQSIKSAI